MPACIWNHINIQWRVVKTLLWQDHDDRGSRRWKQNTKKSYRALLAWGEIWHYLASVCSASFEANSAQVESLLLLPPLILHYEARSSWEKNLSKKLNHFSEVNSTSPTRPCITKIHCGLFRKYFFRRNQIVMSFLDSFWNISMIESNLQFFQVCSQWYLAKSRSSVSLGQWLVMAATFKEVTMKLQK